MRTCDNENRILNVIRCTHTRSFSLLSCKRQGREFNSDRERSNAKDGSLDKVFMSSWWGGEIQFRLRGG